MHRVRDLGIRQDDRAEQARTPAIVNVTGPPQNLFEGGEKLVEIAQCRTKPEDEKTISAWPSGRASAWPRRNLAKPVYGTGYSEIIPARPTIRGMASARRSQSIIL